MSHVFISYKNEDGDFAAELTRQIEDAGFQVWSDNERLRAGEQWREAIDQAIRDAFALIVILTPEAKVSEQMMYEWTFALGVGVHVIPVLLHPTELHPRLESLQCLDFTDRAALPWGKLLRQIQDANIRTNRTFGSPFGPRERPSQLPTRRNPPPSILDRFRTRVDNQDDDLSSDPAPSLDTISALISSLENDDREARISAARRLGDLGDRSAVSALLKVLRDDDWRVRDAAAVALGKLKAASAVPGLLEVLRNGRPSPFGSGPNVSVIIGAIREIGAQAIPVLIDALSDDDFRIRLHATEALGDIDDPDTLPALIAALHDPEWRVRCRAAESLGKLGSELAVFDLVQVLRDSSQEVRMAAAWALGQTPHESAVPGLVRLLHDRDWRVRWAAAEALWRIGEEAVIPLLDKLRDRDEAVRRVAVRALAEIGQPAIPELLKMLNDSNWDARWSAAEALQEMGDAAVPPLVEALETLDWRASWAAAEALKRIGTKDALQAVEAWRQGRSLDSLSGE